jgi:DMSO/TMAO reductase YedYZ molybdopterin-dependent catalytic subunit
VGAGREWLVYLTWIYLHGEWRDLVPGRGDARDAWQMMKFYLFLRRDHPRQGKHNALQKLAYFSLPLVAALVVVSGIAIWKPVQFAPLTNLLDGYDPTLSPEERNARPFLKLLPHERPSRRRHGTRLHEYRSTPVSGARRRRGIGSILAACNSQGPAAARSLLKFAERSNEKLERRILRNRSRDVAPDAPLVGNRMPAYSIMKPAPVWDPAIRGAWTLAVDGLVQRPLRFNQYCVEGWNAVTEFTGVRVNRLAQLAGVSPDAGYVDFVSFDSDYHESWDIDSALHPQTLVAFAREGYMLSPAYGAPARLHSPIKLGYKSVQYLTRITFMRERNGGYWSDQCYEWFAGV